MSWIFILQITGWNPFPQFPMTQTQFGFHVGFLMIFTLASMFIRGYSLRGYSSPLAFEKAAPSQRFI
jgi:hypothetical protein